MKFLDWFRSESKHFRATHLPLPSGAKTAVADVHYVRLWLVQMMLKDGRTLFDEYTPAVHAAVRFVAGQKTTEVATVAGPPSLPGLDKTEGDLVHGRHALTGLIPFLGGSIELAAGLVAYKKEGGHVDTLIGLLGQLSDLLKVPAVGTLVRVADPVKEGIQRLAGAGDRRLMLSHTAQFAGTTEAGGNPLNSGYIAVIRDQIDPSELSVINDTLHRQGAPLRGVDAMLLVVEVADTRDDWKTFGEWNGLIQEAIEAELEGESDKAQGLLRQVRKAINLSPDLTKPDRLRIRMGLEADFKAETGGGAGLAPAMVAMSPMERAAMMGPDPATARDMPDDA